MRQTVWGYGIHHVPRALRPVELHHLLRRTAGGVLHADELLLPAADDLSDGLSRGAHDKLHDVDRLRSLHRLRSDHVSADHHLDDAGAIGPLHDLPARLQQSLRVVC